MNQSKISEIDLLDSDDDIFGDPEPTRPASASEYKRKPVNKSNRSRFLGELTKIDEKRSKNSPKSNLLDMSNIVIKSRPKRPTSYKMKRGETPSAFRRSEDRLSPDPLIPRDRTKSPININNQSTKSRIVAKFQDYDKIKPKSIIQDKEKLFEETIHLKNTLNLVYDENLKLKTRINILERESTKNKPSLNESYFFNSTKEKLVENNQSNLIYSLRLTVKEMKQVIAKKDEEILSLKKNIKSTKITEIEIEMKKLIDENIRLRALLEQIMLLKKKLISNDEDKSKLEEKYLVQLSQIKTLKRDNEEMATAIRILEEHTFNLENNLNEYEKKMKKEAISHKKIIHDKEREISILRNSLSSNHLMLRMGKYKNREDLHTSQTDTASKEDHYYAKLEKCMVELEMVKAENNQKDNKITALERQLREIKSETSARGTFQNVIGRISRDDNSVRSPNLASMKETSSQISIEQEKMLPIIDQSIELKGKNLDEFEEFQGLDNKVHENSPKRKKKVGRILSDQVKDLGYEINLKLKAQGYNYKKLFESLWTEDQLSVGVASIKELIIIFMGAPFNIENEEKATLLARYLVENNQEEFLFYEENATNEIVIIESIFRKIVGQLMESDMEEIRKSLSEIKTIFSLKSTGIEENVLKIAKKSGGYLNKQSFEELRKMIDIPLTNDQIDFIILKILERDQDLKQLSVDTFLKVFGFKKDDYDPSKQYKKNQETSTNQKNKITRDSVVLEEIVNISQDKLALNQNNNDKVHKNERVKLKSIEGQNTSNTRESIEIRDSINKIISIEKSDQNKQEPFTNNNSENKSTVKQDPSTSNMSENSYQTFRPIEQKEEPKTEPDDDHPLKRGLSKEDINNLIPKIKDETPTSKISQNSPKYIKSETIETNKTSILNDKKIFNENEIEIHDENKETSKIVQAPRYEQKEYELSFEEEDKSDHVEESLTSETDMIGDDKLAQSKNESSISKDQISEKQASINSMKKAILISHASQNGSPEKKVQLPSMMLSSEIRNQNNNPVQSQSPIFNDSRRAPINSRLLESQKTNFTNTTQFSDPKEDSYTFEESKREEINRSRNLSNKSKNNLKQSIENSKKSEISDGVEIKISDSKPKLQKLNDLDQKSLNSDGNSKSNGKAASLKEKKVKDDSDDDEYDEGDFEFAD